MFPNTPLMQGKMTSSLKSSSGRNRTGRSGVPFRPRILPNNVGEWHPPCQTENGTVRGTLVAVQRPDPQRSFRKLRCDGPPRRAPQRRPSADPDLKQVAQVHLPQTADWQSVGTGSHDRPHHSRRTLTAVGSPSTGRSWCSWQWVFAYPHVTVLGMPNTVGHDKTQPKRG